MPRRNKIRKRKSKRQFTRNSGTHRKNRMSGRPMRGGIRL